MLTEQAIEAAMCEAMRRASARMPCDIKAALEKALADE